MDDNGGNNQPYDKPSDERLQNWGLEPRALHHPAAKAWLSSNVAITVHSWKELKDAYAQAGCDSQLLQTEGARKAFWEGTCLASLPRTRQWRPWRRASRSCTRFFAALCAAEGRRRGRRQCWAGCCGPR
ncbi:hypothetical protein DFH27DRAFT_529295 [Peziza echinospora]|nr:hypothetical protein DFH27DRAFT_529295 [Peziza echinospora]